MTMKTVVHILFLLVATVFLLPAHAQTDSLYYGTLDEMIAKMQEFDRPTVLFRL